jgi:heterodisulfide reductase subunit C
VEEAARAPIEPGDALYDAAMFRVCEQCGCCSSACPMTGVDDFNIRRILRHLEFGLEHEVVNSPMPWMCAACGRCEDACPNGIGILDIVRAFPASWGVSAPVPAKRRAGAGMCSISPSPYVR